MIKNLKVVLLALVALLITTSVASANTANAGPSITISEAVGSNPAEQSGFTAAVSFSLDRNRNAELAQIGANIARTSSVVGEARNAQRDVFYRLGFDIATGLFGDPVVGARGNTQVGPGSLAIRDALSPPAQRGFNASMTFNLARRNAPLNPSLFP